MCDAEPSTTSSVLATADREHACYVAGRARLLRAVADLEESGAWRGHGAGNLASFLAARWQISPASARELVREAKTLSARPALAEALGGGSISVDQCKALVRLTEEGTDDDEVWLEALWSWPYRDLEREARRAVARRLERTDDGVFFRMAHTQDERYLRGEFQLHPEEGAVILSAVDARIPKGTLLRNWDRAAARALVELAAGSSEKGSAASSPATVLVSVPEAALVSAADQVASVGSGTQTGFVGPATARRLACDARLQGLLTGTDGRITGTGRTSRTIPPHLRRAVLERDGGMCTFPGCGRDRYLEVHHIRHVAEGGPTELPNLLLTCFDHHKLVHEGGWSLSGEAGPHITWIRPDGSPFEPRVRVVLDTC